MYTIYKRSQLELLFNDALYNPPQQTNYALFGFYLFDEKKYIININLISVKILWDVGSGFG